MKFTLYGAKQARKKVMRKAQSGIQLESQTDHAPMRVARQAINVAAIFGLLAMLGLGESASATTYYVATYGNNANAGTGISTNQAWLTISKATGNVVAGDTVYVRGGIYNTTVGISTSGTASKRISLLAYSNEVPVVNAGTGGTVFWVGGDYITLSGFVATGGTNNGVDFRGDYGIVENMTITNIQESGIYFVGDYGQILTNSVAFTCNVNNRLLGPGVSGWPAAIGICNQTVGVGNVNLSTIVRGNVVFDNWGDGINAFQVDGTIVENNVAYDNFSTCFYIDTARNVIFRNNLAYCTTNVIPSYQPCDLLAMDTETASKPPSCNALVVNNMFAAFGWANNVSVWGWSVQPNTGVIGDLFANNTFVNATLQLGVSSATNNYASRFQNNIFYSGSGNAIITRSSSSFKGNGMSFSNNVWSSLLGSSYSWATNSGDFVGDPKLALTGPTNAGQLSAMYFALTTNTPAAVSNGLAIYGVTDYYGVTNQVAPLNRGAYQPTNSPFQYITNSVTYPLTVNNGLGSGKHVAGQTLAILTNPPSSLTFRQWVVDSGSAIIGNVTNYNTALTMPAGAASVTACYYNAGSAVTGVTPASGVVAGGTTVVISGTTLGNGSDITNVTICGVAAAISSQSANSVAVQTRAAALPGLGSVVVWSASAGVIGSAGSYTYIPPAPTALVASGLAPSSFYANWTSVNGATNYLLDVSALTNFTTFLTGYNNLGVGPAMNYQVVGLVGGSNYYYRVRAQQNGIASSNSSVAFIYLPAYAAMMGQASPTNAGSVTGGGIFVVGSTNGLTATASNGWVFSAWNDSVTNNPRSVIMPANGVTYAAAFSSLTVPIMAHTGMFTNHFGFSANGALNQTVVMEACTNLTSPIWLPLQTNTLGNDATWLIDQTTLLPSARYYRLRNQ